MREYFQSHWVSMLASIIALLAALISLWQSTDNTNTLQNQKVEISSTAEQLAETKKTLAELEVCPVDVLVEKPSDGKHVGPKVRVSGWSTKNDRCQTLFIIVRGESPPSNYWRVTDRSQVQKSGKWSGVALLDHIPSGDLAFIEARVTANPAAYHPGQQLDFPPGKGARSNTIHVRRVE